MKSERELSGRAAFSTLVIVACALAALTPLPAQADTFWLPAAADGNWANAANWDAGVPTAGVAAQFTTSNFTTLSHPADANVLGLSFSGGAAFTVNAGGGVMYVYDGGITVNGGAVNQVFNTQVRPRGTLMPVVNNGTGLLDFNADMMIHQAVTGTTTVTFGGSGNIEVNGFQRRNNLMTANLVKDGAGTLTVLSGTTTDATASAQGRIAGTVTVNAGILSVQSNDALGTGTVILAGGTLRPNGGNRSLANNIQVTAASNLLDNVGTGNLGLTGALSGSGSLTINSTLSRSMWFQGDNSALAGTINYTNNNNGTNLRLGGTGTALNALTNGSDFSGASFVLSGSTANNRGLTWCGAAGTTVSLGALSGTGRVGNVAASGNAANWQIGGLNTSTTFSGIFEGAGTALTKVGTGTLTLSGASTNTGQTTISAGTLQLAGGANRLYTGGSLYLAAAGIFDLNGQNQAVNNMTSAHGQVQLNGGAILQVNGGDFWANTIVTGSGGLTKAGGGILTFGANTANYTGGTIVNDGKLWLYYGNNKLPITGDVTVNSPGILDLAHSNSPGTVQTIGRLMGGGTVNIGNTGSAVNFTVGNGDGTSTFSGDLANGNGALTFTKVGSGTLTLARDGSASGTYTGDTIVNGGTLALSGTNAPAGASKLASAWIRVNPGATLHLAGLAELNWAAGTPSVALDASNLTMTDGQYNYVKNITMANGSTWALGTGQLVNGLTGANFSLTNVTSTGAGNTTNTISSRGGALAANAGIAFNVARGTAASDLTVSAAMTDYNGGVGTITKTGGGILTLTAGNTYTGDTTVNGGTLVLSGSALGGGVSKLASPWIRVNSGATLHLASGAQLNWGAGTPSVALDAANLTMTDGQYNYVKNITMANGSTWALGTGLLVNGLTGANFTLGNVTSTGAGSTTNIISSRGGAIDATAGVTFDVARGTAASDLTVRAPLTNYNGVAGKVTKTGGGILTLSGVNTYTGGTTVKEGTVIDGVSNTGAGAFGAFNAAPSAITVLGGATVDINGRAQAGTDFFWGLTLAGSGASGQGALVNNGANGNAGNRSTPNITLSADAAIGGTGHIMMINSGYTADTLDLAGHTLTKTGANTFYLCNTTVTAGAIAINQGVVSVVNRASNASAAAFILANTAGAALTLNGYDLGVASLSGGGTTGGNVNLGGNALTIGGANSTTYAGAIGGTGGRLIKSGLGTQTLTGTNAYSGATTVSGGKLIVDGSIATGGSLVTVGPDAALGGSGFTPAVTVQGGGRLAPGSSPGTLHTGTLTLQSGSFFDVEMSPSAWDMVEMVNTLGAVNLNSATLNLLALSSFSHYQGGQYMIVQNDSANAIGGIFDNLPEGATLEVAGNQFAITYTGGTGNDVVLTAVPEPATMSLVVLSAAWLGRYIRRRKN